MKHKFYLASLVSFLIHTAMAAPTLSIDAVKRDVDGRINGATLAFQGLSARVHALYACFDTVNRGQSMRWWAHREFIQNITETEGTVTVELPPNVLAEYPVVRYFLFESSYTADDYPVEYLKNDRVSGSHTAPYIDTLHTLKAGQKFELVYANATDFDGYNYENKGWGAGSSLGVNVTGGGRAAHDSGNTYQIRPFIYGSERYLTPAVVANDLPPMVKFRDVVTVGEATTSYTMERLSDGTVYAISPVTTPNGANYDSGYTICLFSDSGNGNYKYCGRKLIYSAKLSNASDGTAVFDLEPWMKAGTPGFVDKVTSAFLTNAGGTDWTFTTGPVPVANIDEPAATVLAQDVGTGVPLGEVTIVCDTAAPQAVFAVKSLACDIYFVCSSDASLLTAPAIAWGDPVAVGVPAGGVFELPIAGLAEGSTGYFACRFANDGYTSPVRRGSFTVAAKRTLQATASEWGKFLVSVGAGEGTARLVAAYGATDCGDAVGNWPRLETVGTVDAAGGDFAVTAPDGWMKKYFTARFFIVETPYDTAVDYIASEAFLNHQTVNLGIQLKIGSIFRFEWAMHQLSARVSTSESKGWGVGASLALNITGSRILHSNNIIQPYIYSGERSFRPSASLDIAAPGVRLADVCDIGAETTSYTMTSLRDGTVYAITPVATPADYDSQATVQLFSDTPGSYTYWGVRRIYSAAISERTADGAGTNDVARMVPVVVDGEGAFYDEIRGTLHRNADTESTLTTGPAAFTARVQCGASATMAESSPSVALTPCPLGDGKIMFAITAIYAGAGAESVDLQLGWGPYGDKATMAKAYAAVKPGATIIFEADGFEAGAIYSTVCRAVNNLGIASETRQTFCNNVRSVTCTPERPPRGASRIELAFEPSGSPAKLCACFGTRDGGCGLEGWDFIDTVTVPAAAASLAYVMPDGWGKDYTRARFVIINNSVYPVEYIESVGGTQSAEKSNYIDTGWALAYGRTLEVEWANTRPGGFAELGENKGWGCGASSEDAQDDGKKYNFAGGGRIWPANSETPDADNGYPYDHINVFMTWAAAANNALGHMPVKDDYGIALAAADVVPYIYYRDTFVAGDNLYTLYMTNLTTGAGYTAAREVELGGTGFVAPFNIFLFGDSADCNYPGYKRIRSVRMTGPEGNLLCNLVPFAKDGQAAFYDTVSKSWKTRYYENRADLQVGSGSSGDGMAQGVSPLVRSLLSGLIIQVR